MNVKAQNLPSDLVTEVSHEKLRGLEPLSGDVRTDVFDELGKYPLTFKAFPNPQNSTNTR